MRETFYLSLLILLFPAIVFGASFERDLYYGISSDSDVTRLQEFLIEQDVYSGPVTGNFFTLTREGVKRFQAREGIEPVLGYFGPKTRARANELLVLTVPQAPADQSGEALIAFLTQRIAELQAELVALLEESQIEESAPSEGSLEEPTEEPVDEDVTPPVFTTAPAITVEEFLDDASIADPRYAYRVVVEWSVEEVGISESIACTPTLEPSESEAGKAVLLPEAGTAYACTVTITDAAENESAEVVTFTTPEWVGIAGDQEQEFPPIVTIPLKLGDLKIYNGTDSEVLFSRFTVDIVDEMDSVRNRNRKVYFIFRDGTERTDTQISKNDFTFILKAPTVGNPHTSRVENFSFPVSLKAGEEKTVRVWVEPLEFVRSGSLEIKMAKVHTTSSITSVGTFSFRLTKEPSG